MKRAFTLQRITLSKNWLRLHDDATLRVSQTHLRVLTRIRFYASSMTSSFTSDSALSLGRIDRMCVRCTAVKLGCLWITSGLPTPLLFHAIWDRSSILSFSVATWAATRALPPKFRGVCWSTGLLYRPPWWQLILLICHRLIDSCHYSVCKRESTGLLLIAQTYRNETHNDFLICITRN